MMSSLPGRVPSASTSSISFVLRITSEHLARRAYVYVRQSSPKQVRENTESQILQYRLAERAVQLGWSREQVEVLDADQGQSGADATGRVDFQTLVAEVSLGRAGIVLALEVSRLARNGRDWYQLLELCALFGTLIADAEGVYDPRQYNDRLLLGLKGTLSEAELHLLRQRMDAGRREKARRGELVQHVPTGYVRDEGGRVCLDPDASVQAAIGLVFERFRSLRTAEKVMRFFRKNGLLLPRHQTSGEFAGQTLWKPATSAAVTEILHNPAYAGAFAYGRRPGQGHRRPAGVRNPRLPMEQWEVLIRDAHPAYLSWEEWESNQAQLRQNTARSAELWTPGVPREGRAILAGLLRCGRCGMQLRVSYKDRHRYGCDGLTRHYGGERCFSVPGALVDQAVRDTLFEALRPEQIDLLERLLAERTAAQSAVDAEWQRRLERAHYDVHLAERRYRAVDPENRLVAAALEREWNAALAALEGAQAAREEARRIADQERGESWSAELKEKLRDLGKTLPELWPDLTNAQRSRIIRTLVSHVVLWRPTLQRVRLRIVWITGHYSERELTARVLHFRDMDGYPTLLERIRTWVMEGASDAEIATRLRSQGIRSPRGLPFTATMIGKLRRDELSLLHPLERSRNADQLDGCWTVAGLARHLGVHYLRIYRLVCQGTLPARRHPLSGNHLVDDDPVLLSRLRDQLSLPTVEAAAATALGR